MNQTPSVYTTSGIPFGSFYGSTANDNIDVVKPGKPRADKTTLYLSVPLMAGTSFLKGRLLIRTGATLSYLINASQYITTYSMATGTTTEHKENSTNGYRSFLAGAAIQSTYRVTKYLGVDISYQHSLTPIYTEKKSRYNTLSLGLSYNLSL
jgi:hypothetical protein